MTVHIFNDKYKVAGTFILLVCLFYFDPLLFLNATSQTQDVAAVFDYTDLVWIEQPLLWYEMGFFVFVFA